MTPAMTAYIDANQPVSALQIAQALSVTRQAVYEQYRSGAMHIVEWARSDSGHCTALYVLGNGLDAPRPRAMSQKQRSRAYWVRHSAIIKSRRPSKTRETLGVWAGLVGVSA